MTVIPAVPEPNLSHTDRARLVLEHIRGIKELISGFTFAGDPDPRSLNSAKSVPDAFLEMTAVALEASPELTAIGRVEPAELRDAADFSMAFSPVADELEIMYRAVRHTIAIRRATVGQLALQVYQLVKTFARKTQRQIFMPHLENMKVALGRSRPKSVDKAEPKKEVANAA